MMPREFSRSERIAGQLRREIAQLLQMEVKDPDIGLISVSDVEVTRDLAHARVFVTVFDSAQAPATLKALQHAAGFIRTRLGQEVRMRTVPELHFHHDASIETGQYIDQLIARAVAADRAAGGDQDGLEGEADGKTRGAHSTDGEE